MKTLLIITGILLTATTFGQVQKADSTHKRAYRLEKNIRLEVKPVKITETISDVFGDYIIDEYVILSTNTPCAKDLNALIGTLIRIQDSNVTGAEIDPISYEMYDIEHMSRSDYIFRVFGRGVRAPEPDLPSHLKVHKTDNESCYGIVDLGNGKAAIPYKGVLLYLSEK